MSEENYAIVLQTIDFQVCQTDECCQLRQIITEEVGFLDIDELLDPPITYLQLFNVVPDIPLEIGLEQQQLLAQLLNSNSNELRPLLAPGFREISFISMDPSQVRGLLFTLLTTGTAGGANAIDNPDLAYKLIEGVLNWFGEDCHYYTCFNRFSSGFENWHPSYSGYQLPQSGGSGWSLFKTNYCGDEGVIFISKSKAGIFWFFGED